MALDFPVGSDFPANGNQIPDGHEHSGFYWDATVGVWKRVCDGGERYLLAHGDEVLDCDDPVEYKWNEALSFATTTGDIDIDAPIDDNEKVNRTIEDDDDIKQITNKEYVDVKDEELRQNIIELEEEIDAIAPSVEYGTWEWANPSNNPRPPAAGTFHLLDATGALTDQYKDVQFIKIHNDEYLPPGSTDPVDTHTWADADPSKLIQLFDKADPDFLLGEIVTTTPDTDSVLIEVQLVQTSGVPNDNAVGGVYLSRINVFSPPSGGDAGDFVRKQGDTMEGPGPLVIKTTKTSSNVSGPPSNTAYIKFENNNNGAIKNSSMYIAGGTVGRLCVNSGFQARGDVYSSGYFLAHDGSNAHNAKIYITSSAGNLRYNDTNFLTWGSQGITEIKAKNNNGDKGTVFKRTRDSTNQPAWQGVVDISPAGTDRATGELWYNANDGVLYLKVS